MPNGSQTAVDVTPSLKRLQDSALQAGFGYLGGIAQILGERFIGPDVGPLLAGAVAGAVLGGETGRIITVTSATNAAWRSYQS